MSHAGDVNRSSRLDRWRKWLDLITTAVVLIVCSVLLWRLWPGSQGETDTTIAIPASAISLEGAQAKGSPEAGLGLLMFMDFQCPYCRRFTQQTLGELERQYVGPGLLRIAFRHLPPSQLHAGAVSLAEGASCAGRQGRFWEAASELYRVPKVEPQVLPDLAKTLKLDLRVFERCRAGEAIQEVRQDVLFASDLGLTSTPAFFLGRMEAGRLKVSKTFSGALPLVSFQKAIGPCQRF